MPRGDGTGPMGMGPMSGRAAGFCAGYSVPGFTNPGGRGAGFGRGRGMGFGRGMGNRFCAFNQGPYQGAMPPPGTEQHLNALKNQAQMAKSQLDIIQQRIAELENKAE